MAVRIDGSFGVEAAPRCRLGRSLLWLRCNAGASNMTPSTGSGQGAEPEDGDLVQSPPNVAVPKDVAEAVRTLIRWAGDDPDREGLLDTPKRVARAWREYAA